jgi:hypothetical protein
MRMTEEGLPRRGFVSGFFCGVAGFLTGRTGGGAAPRYASNGDSAKGMWRSSSESILNSVSDFHSGFRRRLL